MLQRRLNRSGLHVGKGRRRVGGPGRLFFCPVVGSAAGPEPDTKKGRPEGLPCLLENDGLSGDQEGLDFVPNRWNLAIGLDEFRRRVG